jgi:hypothetical protein
MKNRMKKSQHMPVWLKKLVILLDIGFSLLTLVKCASRAPAGEECNKLDLTAAPCVFDWQIVIIGPSGLLEVVLNYLQPVYKSYGWGLQKTK